MEEEIQRIKESNCVDFLLSFWFWSRLQRWKYRCSVSHRRKGWYCPNLKAPTEERSHHKQKCPHMQSGRTRSCWKSTSDMWKGHTRSRRNSVSRSILEVSKRVAGKLYSDAQKTYQTWASSRHVYLQTFALFANCRVVLVYRDDAPGSPLSRNSLSSTAYQPYHPSVKWKGIFRCVKWVRACICSCGLIRPLDEFRFTGYLFCFPVWMQFYPQSTFIPSCTRLNGSDGRYVYSHAAQICADGPHYWKEVYRVSV